MQAAIYKLGEYKIIEYDAGQLRWEAHFGLGALQEGRCFTKGTILFIGPADNNRPGFLKGEFLDHLKQFPEWLKAKYYCRGLDVYNCKTGKRVTKEEMLLWMLDRGIDEEGRIFLEKSGQRSKNISIRRKAGDLAFRLQEYQITIKTNCQVLWKTYAGPNTSSGGNCIILEDILFIGSRQNEQSDLIKQQFLANLQQLPKWDQTRYFCPKLSLHECNTGNLVQEEREMWQHEEMAAETHAAKKGYKSSTEFEFKKSEASKHWTKKCVIYAAALILLIISLFFDYLIRFWKRLNVWM